MKTFIALGVKRVQRDFVEGLWKESLTSDESSWKSSARKKLNAFENQLYEAVDFKSANQDWDLFNSLLHSVSLMSTIGKFFNLGAFQWLTEN